VSLKARGIGSCIDPEDDIEVLEHGNQFTNAVVTSTFKLVNKGRRPQLLTWEYLPEEELEADKYPNKTRDELEADAFLRRKRENANRKKKGELPLEIPSVFKIIPERVTLDSMMAMEFQVKGITTEAARVAENWICRGLIGKAKDFVEVSRCQICATFINPLLEFSVDGLSFQYMNDPKNPTKPESEPITVTNVSNLPLVFWMKCPHPFTIDRLEFELAPGESASTNVHFIAGIKGDKMSAKIKSNIGIVYRDHPQRDKLPLFGEICFPNLSFESTAIDFGCIINETSKRVIKTITNNSKIDVEYDWVFYEEEGLEVSSADTFDVLPIRGVLAPGESENIEFVYHGSIDSKSKANVYCEVVGGPLYEMQLSGEASNVAYKIDRTEIDFGPKELSTTEEQDLMLANTGKVGFDFVIDTSMLANPVVSVSPMSGRLQAGEKQKISVVYSSRLPAVIEEAFDVVVAYFDPEKIKIKAFGVYPQFVTSLPRVQEPEWEEYTGKAVKSLELKAQEAPSVPAKTDGDKKKKDKTAPVSSNYKIPSLPKELVDSNPNINVEMEADRLFYVDHVHYELEQETVASYKAKMAEKKAELEATRSLETVAEGSEATTAAQSKPSTSGAPTANQSADFNKTGELSVKSSTKPLSPTKSPTSRPASRMDKKKKAFHISRYECDFGNVILSTSKKKTFTITNTGGMSISCDIAKKHFFGSIFSVSPLQVVRLPPGQSQEFTVACTTNPKRNNQGKVALVVPITVRNGPSVSLNLSCNITVPDLEVSMSKIDFGPVYMGCRREFTVQLHNTKEVNAEWKFKPMISGNSTKDKEHFEAIPSSGTLAPGARQNVTVAYQPIARNKVAVKIPLAIELNPKIQFIYCSGQGLGVNLKFDPPIMDLGPVLPYLHSTPFEVRLLNESSCDVEVYSLDFDKQYLEEENMMKEDERFANINAVIYEEVRVPGENLPMSFVTGFREREGKKKKEAELAEQERLAAERAERAAQGQEDEGEDGEVGDILPPADQENSAEEQVSEETNAEVEDDGTLRNILVIGGPFSGRTTLCNNLAETFKLQDQVLSLDEIFTYFFEIGKEQAAKAAAEEEDERIRQKGNKKEKEDLAKREKEKELMEPEPEIDPDVAEVSAAVRTAVNTMRANSSSVTRPDTGSTAKGAKTAQPTPKTGKTDKTGRESVAVGSLGSDDSSSFADCYGKNLLTTEVFGKMVKLFVLGSRFENGIIIDGLDNSFFDQIQTAQVIKDSFDGFALERNNDLHVISLDVTEDEARGRMQALLEAQEAIIENKDDQAFLKKFKVVPPKDVEKLNEQKRDQYMEGFAIYERVTNAQKLANDLNDFGDFRLNQWYRPVEELASVDEGEEGTEVAAEEDVVGEGDEEPKTVTSYDRFLSILKVFELTPETPTAVTQIEPVVETPVIEEVKEGDEKQEPVLDGEEASLGSKEVELEDKCFKPGLKWVKGKVVDARAAQDKMASSVLGYIREVFYVPIDESLLDPSWVPPPRTLQLFHLPKQRRSRHANKHFWIVDRIEEKVETVVEEPPEEELVRANSRNKDKKTGKEPEVEGTEAVEEEKEPETRIVYRVSEITRWVIPAKSSKTLLVQFNSPVTGRFSQSLGFEIVGSPFPMQQYDLLARGICSVPEIAQEPRSVFMRRIKTRKNHPLVNKQYVACDNMFDFGSLLIGKDPAIRLIPVSEDDKKRCKKNKEKKVMTLPRKMNAETFRISNTGMFDLTVDFAFVNNTTSVIPDKEEEDSGMPHSAKGKSPAKAPPAAKKPPPKKSGKKSARDGEPEEIDFKTQPIFVVDPPQLVIPQDEVREVTVWAFPQDCAVYNDTLICSIKDNPIPVLFPVQAQGAKPVLQLSTTEVTFDRLLVGQSEHQTIELKNVSTVPLEWKLICEELEEEFSISPAHEGIVPPLQTTVLTVSFKGMSQKEFNVDMALQVYDNETVLGLVQNEIITVKAEAFTIDAKVEFPEAGLDFGTIRVNDPAEQTFTVGNNGKYNIKYKFSTHHRNQKLFDEIFTVEPNEGELVPGQTETLTLTVNTYKEELIKSSDMKLHLVEAGTSEVVRTLAMPISVRSVFSKFRILPVHGIDYGPLELGVSRTKKVQICNDGDFEFDFRLFPSKDRSEYIEDLSPPLTEREPPSARGKPTPKASGKKPPPKASAKASAKKPDAKAGGKAPTGPVEMGPFVVTPTSGSIAPGGTIEVEVTMEPNEITPYLEVLEVDISRRDMTFPGGLGNESNALLLDISGEGCSPGIDTTGFDSIFEEQEIQPTLYSKIPDANYFALEEKTFVFSPVIVSKSGQEGRKERFRILNPFKVPCNVTLRCGQAAEAGAAGGKGKDKKAPAKSGKGGDASVGDCPFTVEPATLHIPTHEHRYVTVTFNPTSLKSFTGVFTATVEDGTDAKSKTLQVDLMGEGTLPHLTVLQPSEVQEESVSPVLNFPRVFCDSAGKRKSRMAIVVQNEGIVTAVARFDMASNPAFSFSGLGQMTSVPPGGVHTFDVDFHPRTPGPHSCEIKMQVLQNQFEVTTFLVQGEGYLEDVTLDASVDNVDGELTEDLDFGDIAVGESVTKELTLVNHSDIPYRFAWDAFTGVASDGAGSGRGKPAKAKASAKGAGGAEDVVEAVEFVFSPSIGHLQPHSSKIVQVTYTSSSPRQHSKVPVQCALQQIRYLSYDERVQSARDRKGGKAPAGKPAAKKSAKGEKPAEPAPAISKEELDELGVEHYDESEIDWDNSMKIAKWVSDETEEEEPADSKKDDKKAAKGGKASARKKNDEQKMVQIFEVAPEPEHEVAPENKDKPPTAAVQVKLSVTGDKSRYECDLKNIHFRPTMMFQVREFKFPIKNTSSINTNYRWVIGNIIPDRPSTSASTSRRTPAGEREPVENPFVIYPMHGRIGPDREEEFTVQFAPLDARSYTLDIWLEVDNVDENQEQTRLNLKGIGQRPKCHFELQQSDYLTAKRRDADRQPFVDISTRVVEFKSLGVKVRNVRRFFVVNPTNVSYSFEWYCSSGAKGNPFRCLTSKGIVESGRKFEMVFEYIPDVDATVESFWRFEIADHGINIPLMFVGSVAEPDVKLDMSHLNFAAVMLGRKESRVVNVVNNEHIPFSFVIDKSSIQQSLEGKPVLDISPLSGVVGPEGTFPINVHFRPNREQDYNWNVSFQIKKKSGRVNLNVKGEGYAIRSLMSLKEEKDSIVSRPLEVNRVHQVDFGVVHMNETRVKQVVIKNDSKVTFNYQWNVPHNRFISISPLIGTIKKGSEGVCDVTFYSHKESSVDNLMAICTLANSPESRYTLSIGGRAKKPNLEFSFLKHDFGRCFIKEHRFSNSGVGAKNTQILRIVNNEKTENVALDMTFETQPHLEVGQGAVLAPGEALDVPIHFTPSEAKKYRDMIPFEVNGLYTTHVLVTGEGTPLKLELANSAESQINFGNVRTGHAVSKTVTLVNHSKKSVALSLVRKESAHDAVLDTCLSTYPYWGQEVVLRSKESLRVEINFQPPTRMPQFSCEVMIHTMGTSRPGFVISGACHGVGMRLESDKMPFGSIILNSNVTKKLNLTNFGDVGCKFQWIESYKPHFSISPAEGFIAAHTSQTMDVTFHPNEIGNDIRFEQVPCLVDGSPMEGMYLTVSGNCVPPPMEDAQEIKFHADVRSSVVQSVTIENDSGSSWVLRPVIKNDYWTGPLEVTVPANGSAEYPLTFTPLMMTHGAEPAAAGSKAPDKRPVSKGKGDGNKSGKKDAGVKSGPAFTTNLAPTILMEDHTRPDTHEGSVFFALPSGKSLLYSLVGTSGLGEPVDYIDCQVTCKKAHVQQLSIKNWLNNYQRFKVIIDMGDDTDASVQVTGASSLDIPGLLERKYKLNFYAYREGETTCLVTFLNETTGEQLSYVIRYTATMSDTVPEQLGTMDTPARISTKRSIVIANPLETDATINEFTCDDPGIFIALPQTIPSKSEFAFDVQYRPLVPAEMSSAPLTLLSPELGEFRYGLTLVAREPAPERSVRLSTSLGMEATAVFRFKSFCTKDTVFDCKLEGQEFLVDPKITAAACPNDVDGVETVVEIRYEPSAIGEIRDTLTVSSAEGGTYVVSVTGSCEPPKPQGPFVVKPNAAAQIKFKNVLDIPEQFNFAVDNPAFVLAKKFEKINKKSVVNISVSYKPLDGGAAAGKGGGAKTGKKDSARGDKSARGKPDAPVAKDEPKPSNIGKLLVTCPAVKNASWLFYLQGAKA